MSKVTRDLDERVVDIISPSRYISHVSLGGERNPIISTHYMGERGVLFRADCLDLLANIRQETIDLVFADPPFNLGKEYEDASVTDDYHDESYRGWCRTWILEMVRVLKPGGALFLYHLPRWLMDFGAWLNGIANLEFHNWIAMKMKNGFPIRGRLHPAHYGLLYFTKSGQQPKFNVVRMRTPNCRKCGTLARDYGGYRKKYKQYEDNDGIPWVQISDFWEDTRPATHDKTRENHINELPIHVAERAILMATNPGDVVLDCFAGAGSTIHAAQRNNRFWIAADKGDTEATLRRITTFWGRREAGVLPKHIEKCFTKKFREAIPKLKPSGVRPIKKVSAIPAIDPDAYRYAARSKVLVSGRNAVPSSDLGRVNSQSSTSSKAVETRTKEHKIILKKKNNKVSTLKKKTKGTR